MTGIWLVSFIALWILFLVVAVILLSVLRNLGVLYESLKETTNSRHGPTTLVAGRVLPDVPLQTLRGDTVALSTLQGIKTAVSVISPHCGPCQSLLHDIAQGNTQADPLDPSVKHRVVVSMGGLDETNNLVEQVGLPESVPVFVDAGTKIGTEWGVNATPTTVIVDERLQVVRQIMGA